MSDSQPTKAGINPPVFFPSVAVIGVLVVFGAVFPEKADHSDGTKLDLDAPVELEGCGQGFMIGMGDKEPVMEAAVGRTSSVIGAAAPVQDAASKADDEQQAAYDPLSLQFERLVYGDPYGAVGQ